MWGITYDGFLILNRITTSASQYDHSLQSYMGFYEYKDINGFINTKLSIVYEFKVINGFMKKKVMNT